MQVVCIRSTGSGTETDGRPRGQGGGKTAHAASILSESTLTGAEHAINSPCMPTRSSSGLGVAKSGAGAAGIKPGVGLGKEHCWLRSRALFCMFLGRSKGILTIISALFIHIADTMLYVNLVGNSALSLRSYPGHERDSAAEAQRLIKARQCALSPPTLFSLHDTR